MSFFISKKQTDGGDDLPREYFWKEYKSPVTGNAFKAVTVKTNSFTVRSRDPDFAPHYQGVNLLYYGVIVDPAGFAAEAPVYAKSPALLFADKPGLLEYLSQQASPNPLRGIRTIGQVCVTYERALNIARYLRISRYDVASLALKASWVFKELLDSGNQPAAAQISEFRKLALDLYLECYEQEDVSRVKLGSGGVAYLIAELFRERGDYDESMRWFSRAVTDTSIGGEVKRVARNQFEICREERRAAKKSGTHTAPKPERRRERTMFQVYADQAEWLSKTAGQAGITESELMRGLLQGLKEGGLKPELFRSEQELADWLKNRLGQ